MRYRVYLCPVDQPLEVPHPWCPNAAQHTPCPPGYVQWHEWAEEMAKTHDPVQCADCGRYVLHKPINAH